MLVVFTGCSSKNNPKPVNRMSASNIEKNVNLSPKENLVRAIYIVAKIHQKYRKYDYFAVKGIPSSITNTQDLVNYCFPESNGFNNLSQKCNKLEVLYSFGYSKNERDFSVSYWDTNKTLNDPFLINIVENQIAKKDSTFKLEF